MQKPLLKNLRTKIMLVLVALVFPAALAAFALSGSKNYALISFAMVIMAIVPFLMLYEMKKPQAREWIPLAVMAAIAAVGRAAFAALPHFKPVSAIIIITAMTFGPEAGFLTGAVAALASNLFFGQGPWTPWQMFAYGITGFIAGLLARRGIITAEKKLPVTIFSGLVIMLVTGPLLDLCTVFTMSSAVDASSVLSVMAAGIPFNAVLAVSTMATVFILCRPMLEKLDRIKKKYGIMEAGEAS